MPEVGAEPGADFVCFRASKYGYQGSKNQAEILLSGIRGVNDVFHKVFTG